MNSYDSLKVPPHSIEAEQSVLGGLLISGQRQDGSAYNTVSQLLVRDDFYRQDHRLIFTALSSLADDRQPIDVLTATEWLRQRHELENAGGLFYLGQLVQGTPSYANIKAYAEIVRNHSLRRQMIAVCTQLIDKSFQATTDNESVEELIETGVAEMFKLERTKNTAEVTLKSLKKAVKDKLSSIDELCKSGKPADQMLNGIPTGFASLDARWSGLEKGKVYTVAARPGMGKTAWLVQASEHAAHAVSGQKQFVAVFSLEMDIDELAERYIATTGRADYGHIRQPWLLTADDWPRIATGVKRISGSNILIDDSSALKPSHIRQRVRKIIAETGATPAAIFVDYLQLMSGDQKAYGNRELEISDISRALKRLAKDFQVPLVQLSQLNRSLESRVNKRPVLSDLRGSGSIEQDSNNVLFLYREAVYAEDCGHNKAEMISAKVRGGEIGADTYEWDGQHQRFVDPFANSIPAEYSDYADHVASKGGKGGW